MEITDSLKEKGWSEQEIERVSKVFEEAHQVKSPRILIIDKVVYWAGLFLAILGNFFISVLLIPFLVLMKSYYLYLALLFLGVTFGWLFSVLINDIEAIKSGQHIVAWIFIPAIGIINIYIMANLSNRIASLLEISTGIHNAPAVSVVYVISFMFPYALSKWLKRQSL